MNEEEYQRLRDYALKLLSFRPRSLREMKDKIRLYCSKHQINPNQIDALIKELIQKKFLNDWEFTRWWIEQRSGRKPKGVIALSYELQNKGISKEIISEVIKDVRLSDNQEIEFAKKMIRQKFPNLNNIDNVSVKNKLAQLLKRQGFTYDIIYQVIDSIKKKE